MINLIDIAPTFSFILDKGFVPGTVTYDPEEFGNASLVMAGRSFSLRFDRDRGQVFMDVGSDAVGWHKLEYVLEFLDNEITEKQLGTPPDLAVLANLLQVNWDKVVNLFNDEQKMSQFQAFTKQKTASIFGEIFAKF